MLHKATQSIRKQISSMTPKIWKYWSLFSRQFLWLERWRLLDPEEVNINLKRLSSFTPLHRISLSVNVHKHVVRAMSILTSLRSNWKIFLENSAWPKNCPATAFTRTELAPPRRARSSDSWNPLERPISKKTTFSRKKHSGQFDGDWDDRGLTRWIPHRGFGDAFLRNFCADKPAAAGGTFLPRTISPPHCHWHH